MSALLLDVNVVLAASRDDHPHHDLVRPWFDDLLATRAEFGVPSLVWASFLRLATNRRIFPIPTPMASALDFGDQVRAQPGCVALEPGTRHAEVLRRVCLEGDASGDLVPDAVLAAIAIEHGAIVTTLDRDFARFEGLRTVRPVLT